jgi:hypothetical protein
LCNIERSTLAAARARRRKHREVAIPPALRLHLKPCIKALEIGVADMIKGFG